MAGLGFQTLPQPLHAPFSLPPLSPILSSPPLPFSPPHHILPSLLSLLSLFPPPHSLPLLPPHPSLLISGLQVKCFSSLSTRREGGKVPAAVSFSSQACHKAAGCAGEAFRTRQALAGRLDSGGRLEASTAWPSRAVRPLQAGFYLAGAARFSVVLFQLGAAGLWFMVYTSHLDQECRHIASGHSAVILPFHWPVPRSTGHPGLSP